MTWDELGRGVPRGGRGADRGRRRHPAHRDDLRHAQREGRDLRRRVAVRGARRAAAGRSSRARSSTPRAGRCRARRSRRSGTASATPTRCSSGSTARSGRSSSASTSTSCRGSPTVPVSALPQRRPAQRARRLRRDARGRWPTALGEWARARAAQHRRRRAAARRRSTRRRSPPRWPACRPRRSRGRPPLTRLSGLEPVVIPPPGDAFVNVGERTNVTGSRKFARLIAGGTARTRRSTIARDQVDERRRDRRRQHGRGDARRCRRDDPLPAPHRARSPTSPRSRSWSTARSGRSSRPGSSSSRAGASSTRSRSRRARTSSCARRGCAGATARRSS